MNLLVNADKYCYNLPPVSIRARVVGPPVGRTRTIIIVSAVIMTAVLFAVIAVAGYALPPGRTRLFLLAAAGLITPVPAALLGLLFRALREHSEHAQRYATRDALTDLYNQNAFWDFLNYEIERSKRQKYRFSLLLIDIDNFKAINDRHGHAAGDLFLRRFADLFKRTIRKGDIPARYAGDNFAAILPVCDEAQAHIVAKRLVEGLRETTVEMPEGGQVATTASAGIAVFPHHAGDAQDLYLLADNMLSQAKTAGKDRVSLPLDDVNIDSLRSAGEQSLLVMEALRQRRVVPYFQPIISVNGSSVLAYEVLTRIVTEERVIPAAEFIDVAESMGAMARLTTMLMEQAFRLANEDGYAGTLFINLSPKALVIGDFLPAVRGLMTDHGFTPSRIVFEITERDSVKNTEVIERTVRELRQEGFRFAIDDFGSGYSSFRYIRLFEVDYLKVDGEFIRNMAVDRGTERAIVANIARLAEHLGIKTIAEYVESEAIMDHVRSSGIHYAQGYHINRPSPRLTYPDAVA
jgi:diguanylate cyclase (GGDEF)-like protein